MPGYTNRGKFRILKGFFQGLLLPVNFFIALIDDSIVPTADTNTMADVSEVPAGNGYTSGGISVARDAVDFDVITEDDVNDRALVQIKDIVWTGTGGPLPSGGNGARRSVLTDDNGTVSLREIISTFDLVSNRLVSAGQTLTLQDAEFRLTE